MTKTRSKILDAASTLFLEGGSAALSVRAIARRADMSTIGIYSHFQGKQGILDALYMQAADLVSKAMDVAGEDLSPRAQVLKAAQNYLELSETNEAHYRLFFGESDPGYTPSSDAQKASFAAFAKLLDLISAVMPGGTSTDNVRETALCFWALLHGFFGLRHHSAADKMRVDNWHRLAMDAVANHIDVLMATSVR